MMDYCLKRGELSRRTTQGKSCDTVSLNYFVASGVKNGSPCRTCDKVNKTQEIGKQFQWSSSQSQLGHNITLPPTKLAKKIIGTAKLWARFARMMFEV